MTYTNDSLYSSRGCKLVQRQRDSSKSTCNSKERQKVRLPRAGLRRSGGQWRAASYRKFIFPGKGALLRYEYQLFSSRLDTCFEYCRETLRRMRNRVNDPAQRIDWSECCNVDADDCVILAAGRR